MAVGLGVLGLPPAVFWAMSPKELEAALRGRTGAPSSRRRHRGRRSRR